MDQHKNFASSTVATAPSPATSGLSLVVQAGDGVKFPTGPFNATVRPAGVAPTTSNAEIIRVSSIATDTFTIVRSQENSTPRTIVVGDQISATVTAKTITDVEGAFGTQSFRNLRLRTHYNNDVTATQVALTGLDEAVMSDGTRYTSIAASLPLSADTGASGAAGIDTGSRVSNTWYEIHLIGKSVTNAVSDLRLMFHRAKDYFKDTSFETPFDTSNGLRLGATSAIKLAQGFQLATAGKVEFVDITLQRANAVTGNVWLTIEADSAGNPSGTPLATSDKLNAGFVSTNVGYLRFPFRVPATLSATTQYHLVLQGDYTVSGTNFLVWASVVAGGYANGAARTFNGSVWSAIGVQDFQFRVFVTRNDLALTMPAGYDQFCKLGHVYNKTNVLTATQIHNKRAWMSAADSTGTQVVTNGAAVFPNVIDASGMLPPFPVIFETTINMTTANDSFVMSGSPEGYAGIAASVPYRSVQLNVAGLSLPTFGQIPTEHQAFYYYRFSGTGTINIFIISYEW